eukprot:g8024.t1
MLTVYGVPFSQPVRAVLWVLLYKRLPFKLVLINPGTTGKNGSRHPSFLAKNPGGTIPTIEEEDGFCLGEAHAILTYLAKKHGWTDLYPNDLKVQAKIDQYLHFHHRNIRDCSISMVAPRIRKDIVMPEQILKMNTYNAHRSIQYLNDLFLGVNDGNKFIIGNNLTLADFCCYVEVGQLQAQFTNTYKGWDKVPRVQNWLELMGKVAYHDEVHSVLTVLGDISEEPPTKDTIRNANKTALKQVSGSIASL